LPRSASALAVYEPVPLPSWLGLSTLAPYSLAASLRAAVVKSEEGTSFYVFSGFGL
jgi:hypothetical protein